MKTLSCAIGSLALALVAGGCAVSVSGKASGSLEAGKAKAPDAPQAPQAPAAPETPAAPEAPAAEAPAAEPTRPNMGGFAKAMKKMKARMSAQRDRIEIDEKVMFETDKADIKAESNELLDDVAAVMQQNPDATCEVGGHTDATGKATRNEKLSQERASAVVAYLVAKGVDAARLQARGYGSSQPIDPTKSPEAHEKNRRVEFRVTIKASAQ